MSMGNFIRGHHLLGACMTENERHTTAPQAADGVGMAHLTVVPTNFDPEASGHRQD